MYSSAYLCTTTYLIIYYLYTYILINDSLSKYLRCIVVKFGPKVYHVRIYLYNPLIFVYLVLVDSTEGFLDKFNSKITQPT